MLFEIKKIIPSTLRFKNDFMIFHRDEMWLQYSYKIDLILKNVSANSIKKWISKTPLVTLLPLL